MDLGEWITVSVGIGTIAFTIHGFITTSHDSDVKKLKAELSEVIKRARIRERRLIKRERQCRDALWAIYEWAHWMQLNHPPRFGSAPAPALPKYPEIDEIGDNEKDDDNEDDGDESK